MNYFYDENGSEKKSSHSDDDSNKKNNNESKDSNKGSSDSKGSENSKCSNDGGGDNKKKGHHPPPPPPVQHHYHYYGCRPERDGRSDNRTDYDNDDYCCCCCKPCKKGPEGGKAILKCSCNGGSGTLPATLNQPKYITSLAIDYSGLENPTVLLTFTGDINIPGGATATLTFVVKKVCENGHAIPVGSSHTFIDTGSAVDQTSYSFQICDNSTCNNSCCTYYVYIEEGSTTTPVNTVSVSGAVLSALAISNEC